MRRCPPAWRASQRFRVGERLARLKVGGLGALLARLDLVRHLRALRQGAEPVGVDRAVMDEHVLRAVVGRDEPEALVVAEPLHGSGWHVSFLRVCRVLATRRIRLRNVSLRALALRLPDDCPAGQVATLAAAAHVIGSPRPRSDSRPAGSVIGAASRSAAASSGDKGSSGEAGRTPWRSSVGFTHSSSDRITAIEMIGTATNRPMKPNSCPTTSTPIAISAGWSLTRLDMISGISRLPSTC